MFCVTSIHSQGIKGLVCLSARPSVHAPITFLVIISSKPLDTVTSNFACAYRTHGVEGSGQRFCDLDTQSRGKMSNNIFS